MPRILIVDDNQKNLYLLEAILKGNGYEVIAATNGAEALAAAKDDPPDAVITDILMPVMDGFELCRRWKADEQLNGIPVIFYTATYTDQKDQEFAQKIGVDRFIIKPQKPEVLASEIKRILDERQEKGTVQTSWPRIDEREALQEYSEVLFHKLEQKVMQLEKEIDERKAMEEEREALIRELERKNGELERFTYTVSHDLKSPLITIQGFAGLLEEDAKSGDPSRIKQDIERIISAADRMQELLEDLLALSRIGRVANPPQDVSLETIVREAIDFLVIPVIERKATLEIDPGLPGVHVDPDRIREVYVNLIENAIKFTRPPDHPKIRIGKQEDNGETVFFVQDQGMGIDPQYSSKIFRLFEKLDGQSGGTGIGLSLVERIITCHGGRVWVESEGPGKGTSICFTLPHASGGGIDKEQ